MLTLVPTPIGNLEDITLRALEALRRAEVILCEDTRVAKRLLELLLARGILTETSPVANSLESSLRSPQAPQGTLDSQNDLESKTCPESRAAKAPQSAQDFIESKRFLSFHSHNQEDFLNALEPEFFQSQVVYLSDAGMPCISDPGAKLVAYAIKHHIAFDVLPGACALNVAFCGSGVESTPFVFVGFLPHKKLERQSRLIQLAHLHMGGAYSAICYESPHRILDTLQDIALLLPHIPIIVQKELTKLHQQRYYGTAREVGAMLSEGIIRGEWVIILDFANTQQEDRRTLDYEEALMLDIPPKIKAKILSKMSGKSIKECYEELLGGE